MKKVISLSIIASIFLLGQNTAAQSVMDELMKQERAAGKLFGIQLRPQAVKVLREVEKLAGRPLVESLVDDSGGADVARSWVDDVGTPIIQVMGGRGLNEDTIVHELYHLLLIVKGFPRLKSCPAEDQTRPELVEYLRFARAQLDNAIQHWMFYPQMRRMGLTPQDGYDKLVTLNETHDWNDLTDFMRREGRILHYFRIALEIDDKAVVEHLPKWYAMKGWHEELKVAQEMVELVRKSDLSTPRKVLQVVSRCLQKIERKDFKLEVGEVTIQNYGAYKSMSACIVATPQPPKRVGNSRD